MFGVICTGEWGAPQSEFLMGGSPRSSPRGLRLKNRLADEQVPAPVHHSVQ